MVLKVPSNPGNSVVFCTSDSYLILLKKYLVAFTVPRFVVNGIIYCTCLLEMSHTN